MSLLLLFPNAGGGSGVYTLTAESGSVTIAGTDATLKVARVLVAQAGAVTITGTNAELTYSGSAAVSRRRRGASLLLGVGT